MQEVPSSTSSSASSKPSSTAFAVSSSTIYGRRKLKEDAEAGMFKKRSEAEALKYLWLTKPAYLLQDGSDVWVDQRDVDAKMSEIILKFKINSFRDRASRLEYLLSVLKKKWANKPESYKSMLTFMMEISNPPLDNNLDFQVGMTKYSTKVEEETGAEFTLHGEELRQAELQKRAFRKEVVDELLELRLPVDYSSEEELSDWGSLSASEDEDEIVEEDVPAPPSPEKLPLEDVEPSDEEQKEIVIKFWGDEARKGNLYMKAHLRRVEPMPLTDQPVISSPMVLNVRFGEHWEWKKASALNQRPQKMLLSENDIMRELIWQFACPTNKDSPVFTPDWNLRPEIIVKTLSHSSLKSFLDPYGKLLSKLQKMRHFIRITSVVDSHPPIFHSYAHYLAEVLTFTAWGLDELECSLKMGSSNPNLSTGSDSFSVRPATLLQLHHLLQPVTKYIAPLEHLHSQAISTSESMPIWLKALRLISCLEIHLSLVSDPPLYGLVLYLYSQCLMSTLDQVLRPLTLKDWDNNEFLFRRSTVKVTEPNFWNEIITLQPIEEEFAKMKLTPPSFLNWILPKVHTILKVREIINQLGAGVGVSSDQVINRALPSYKLIRTQFLDELLERESRPLSSQAGHADSPNRKPFPDDPSLRGSTMAGAFLTLLKDGEEFKTQPPPEFDPTYPEIKSFYNLENIPLLETKHPLQEVLQAHLDPYFRFAHTSLSDLFQRYNVTKAIRLLQEIIFGAKEELALACIRLALTTAIHEHMGGLKGEMERPNETFQKLLSHLYPTGRGTFEIEFVTDPRSSIATFELKIHAQFPLTLLLTPRTISRYEHVAKEIFKIRKGLWVLNRLELKQCKAGTGVELNRLFLMRFAMIHFWSSLRAFVLMSIFDPKRAVIFNFNENSDIGEILKVYEKESGSGAIYRILSFKLMDSIVIKPMLHSSFLLSKKWKTGMSLIELTALGVRVKRAWELILELGGGGYSSEMNEIAEYFGPIPEDVL